MYRGRKSSIDPAEVYRLYVVEKMGATAISRLPPKIPERATQIAAIAQLYGVSAATVYRALHCVLKPRTVYRRDHGIPRVLSQPELEHYCELIAALKLRTTNKSGRHLSTVRAIQLLEEYGVEIAQGLVKVPAGLLRKQTVNRWLAEEYRFTLQAINALPESYRN